MTTLKWYEGTLTKAAQARWYEGTITRTPSAAKKARWYEGTITRTPTIKIRDILNTPSVEPGTLVTRVADIQSAPVGTPTWTWEQVSGPEARFLTDGPSVTVIAPSVMPGDDGTVVMGVTATIGATTSPQETFTLEVLPQLRWVYDGTKLIGATPTSTAGPLTTALSSAAVADRLGVQVHMSSDFPLYANNPTTVVNLLNDLGVDHVRDAYNVGWPTQHTRQLQLATDAGVKFTMTARYSDSISGMINGLVTDGLHPYLAALEGINEPDNPGVTGWADLTRTHQQAFYAAAKAKAELAALPVLAPGLANSILNAATLGDLSAWCDRGNAHIYSGNPPTGVGSYTIANTLTRARLVAGASEPVVITEQGYHNEPTDNSPIPSVDETTAGVYAPKILLDNVLAGTERVFIYELLDQGTGADSQQHYGLCRADYSKKPAFTAVAALMALLADPGSAYTPAPLPLTVTPPAGDTTLRTLLVGRRDGTYRLLLWRDVPVWNPSTRTPITVPPITVSVTHPAGNVDVALAGTMQSISITP